MFAPIPSASADIATIVKAGLEASIRLACRISCSSVSIRAFLPAASLRKRSFSAGEPHRICARIPIMLSKLLAICWLAASVHAAEIDGKWLLNLIRAGEEFASARVELNLDGEKLTGTLNELKLAGTARGDDVEFIGTRPDGAEFGKFTGKFSGSDLKGTLRNGSEEIAWVMRRVVVPDLRPVLTASSPPGFIVFFRRDWPCSSHQFRRHCKDHNGGCGGRDQNGADRSPGGNPQTGPFYVEGALPGDVLAVKFLKIRLNRDSARSGNRIVPSALSPGIFGTQSSPINSTANGSLTARRIRECWRNRRNA